MEKNFLLNYVVQKHLPCHIPGIPVSAPPTDRMDVAMSQLDEMIEKEENSERQTRGSRLDRSVLSPGSKRVIN